MNHVSTSFNQINNDKVPNSEELNLKLVEQQSLDSKDF